MICAVCDRCARCTKELSEWWARGKRLGELTRSTAQQRVHLGRGKPYRIACDLIQQFGFVTPEDFAEVSGQTRRLAYFSLTNLVRRGLLEGGCQPGIGTRFRFAERAATYAPQEVGATG